MNWDTIRYFSKEEVTCKCGCGFADISLRLILLLDSLRELTNEPLIINSCLRCKSHNKNEGGSPTSSHLSGWAVDIHLNSENHKVKVLKALKELKITRYGIADDWIHFDIDPYKEDAIWYY